MKAVLCDICKKVMEKPYKRIKYKASEYKDYFDLDLQHWAENWIAIDICPECFEKIAEYIRKEKDK